MAQGNNDKVLAHAQFVASHLATDERGAVTVLAVHKGGQRQQQVRVVVRHVLGAETLAVVLGNEAGVEVPRRKTRVSQQRGLERNVAGDAPDHEAIECLAHLGNGVEPVASVHDQFGNHRVIVHGNLAAVLHAGVHPHPLPLAGVGGEHGLGRRLKAHQTPGGWQKVAKRVLGIDTAFDGPALAFDLVLRQGQRLARSDPNHQLHQVQPGDALGHRVLHLQTGVHLQKVKALVLADHKLHRASTLVIDRLGQGHGLLAHGLAGGVADEGAGRLLDHLLMAALDRALALVQVQHVALAVANELDLDVTRLLDKFFNEHPVVAEAVAGLIAATGEAFQSLLVVPGHAQALATPAGTGLDHHRVTNAARNLNRTLGRLDGIVHTRNAVDPSRASQLFGLDLVAHGGNRMVFGANKDDPSLLHTA